MEFQENLDHRAIPVSRVAVGATNFVLKLKLLRVGPVEHVETTNYSRLQQQLIFVDEEGTKIQTTITDDYSDNWKDIWDLSKVFYVIYGSIRKPTIGTKNVNNDKELYVTHSTRMRVCKSAFSTTRFSNGFTTLGDIKHMEKKKHYDVAGIFIEASEPRVVSGRHTRVVTIIDEAYDRVRVVLLNEQAVHDAENLENAYSCKTIIAFCNVTVTETSGEYSLLSNELTSIMVNPKFERAEELLNWSNTMNDCEVDMALVPSRQFRNATEMELRDMLISNNDNPQNVFCKFVATIREVRPKHSLCYALCKKCRTILDTEDDRKYCKRCRQYQETVEYIYYVQMTLDVNNIVPPQQKQVNDVEYNHEEHSHLTTVTVEAYEGAKFLLGCNANQFVESFKEHGLTSVFYQNIINAEGNKHSFMVKNYHTHPQPRRRTDFKVVEMHRVSEPETNATDKGKRQMNNKFEDSEC